MRLPLRLALVLAVALLVATQGALVHPYAHDCVASHAQASGGPDHDHSGSKANHACDLCMAFSALALAASGNAVVPLDALSAVLASRDPGPDFLPRAPPAFRSQAPPALS